MNKKKLAIIVPAFKISFLKEMLNSVADQTCKDFTLYIGDDSSPYDLYSIVEPYESLINIVYKRFEKNLGGKDLVAQWERCIDMSQDEDWIWLFSDDDIMNKNCVEQFYSEINASEINYLYHFDVIQIDEHSNTIQKLPSFPSLMSSKEFFIERASNKISSFVVEYIFSRKIYTKYGGFQNFDLAWGSDHATWVKFAFDHGIKTIPYAEVSWRYSTENISANRSNIDMSKRKVRSNATYYLWVSSFFKNMNIIIKDSFLLKCFLNDSKAYNNIHTWETVKEEIYRFTQKEHLIFCRIIVIYMYLHRIYKQIGINER